MEPKIIVLKDTTEKKEKKCKMQVSWKGNCLVLIPPQFYHLQNNIYNELDEKKIYTKNYLLLHSYKIKIAFQEPQ